MVKSHSRVRIPLTPFLCSLFVHTLLRCQGTLSIKTPRSHSVRALLRYLLFALAIPCVYFGGAGAAYFYRQHATPVNARLLRLPLAPASDRKTRLFVFAPHPDDETLGCGGLIQQTLAAGGQARVGILTNGDGYRTAVECTLHTLRVSPTDYVRYASLRQEESVAAMQRLGLSRPDVLFFGYPDRGLTLLWNDFWTPDTPYRSAYTRCESSPYAVTFHPGVAYCGQNVLDDIKTALRAFRPTLVTVTHPAEDHPDHAAAAAFVACALRQLQASPADAPWAKQTRLQYYLVHRGDWPLPQGDHPTEPLLPPLAMTRADTRWNTRPLSTAQTETKLQGINAYASQNAMMRRFLISFARHTELLGDMPNVTLARVPDHIMRMDANISDWKSLPPVLLDPVGDNVQRDLQGDGDIRCLYACRDSQNLYLRLDCRQPVSRRFVYLLRLRAFSSTGTSALALRLRPGDTPTSRSGFANIATSGHTLEASVPWRKVIGNDTESNGSIQTLAVNAATLLAGLQEVDRTGVRLLSVAP